MFAKNIKYLRTKNNWTQKDLAGRLGYSAFTTINKWETGVNACPYSKLTKIAQLFNVTQDELMNVDLEKKDNEMLISTSTPSPEAVRINVYGSVPAGIPQEAIADVVDWEDIPKEWTTGGREYFGVRVKGASMEPKYLAGDTVIVRSQPNCESGQDCIVYVNGYDATLKRVVKTDTHYILQPLNPAYETKMYSIDDNENPIIIAGVVVEIRRSV